MFRLIPLLSLLAVSVSGNSHGAPCKVLNNTDLTPQHGAKDDYKLNFAVEIFKELEDGGEEKIFPFSALGGDLTLDSGGIYKVVLVRDIQQSGFLLRAIDESTSKQKPPKDAGAWLDSYNRECAHRVGGLQSGIIECDGNTFMTHSSDAEENCPRRIEFMWQAPKPGVIVTFQAVGVFDWHTKHTYKTFGPFRSKLGDTPPECIDKIDTFHDYCNKTKSANPLEQICLGPGNIRSFCERMCCGVKEKPTAPLGLVKASKINVESGPQKGSIGRVAVEVEKAKENVRPTITFRVKPQPDLAGKGKGDE